MQCAHVPVCLRLQEIRNVGQVCCAAAQVLHDAGLVHRDFREPNVVSLAPGKFMVIDLEMAAEADQVVPADFILNGWDNSTLDSKRRYSRMSDMYLIGCMLGVMGEGRLDEQACQFVASLKAKELTAAAALAHPYIVGR